MSFKTALLNIKVTFLGISSLLMLQAVYTAIQTAYTVIRECQQNQQHLQEHCSVHSSLTYDMATPQTPLRCTLKAVFLEKVSIPHRNSLGKVSIQGHGYNILGKRTATHLTGARHGQPQCVHNSAHFLQKILLTVRSIFSCFHICKEFTQIVVLFYDCEPENE